MKELNHRWKLSEDIVAYYLYKYGSTQEIELAAKKLGIKLTSMKMRINNFAFLDTSKGLRNCSKQSRDIYVFWKNSNLSDLKAEYDTIIS